MNYKELICKLQNRAAMPDTPSADVRLFELAVHALDAYSELATAQEQGRLVLNGKHSTGMTDVNGVEVMEGDEVVSVLNGLRLLIRYGKYTAYCPIDEEYLPNVGFYAESEDLAQMPLGDLSTWARVIHKAT